MTSIAIPLAVVAREATEGRVLDQDGTPLADVRIEYTEHELRPFIPLPFTPLYRVDRTKKVRTRQDGGFTIRRKYEHLDYDVVTKAGFTCQSLLPVMVFDSQGKSLAHLFMYRVQPDEQSHLLRRESEWVPIPSKKPLYFSLESCLFSSEYRADSDIEFCLSERLSAIEWWPFSIRSLGKGLYFCRNNIPYSPAHGYEPGIIANLTDYDSYNDEITIPCFANTSSNLYSRIWIMVDKRRQRMRIQYVYNTAGSRYVGVDDIGEWVDAFGGISHVSPIQTDWWNNLDISRCLLLTHSDRMQEIWDEYKDRSFAKETDTGEGRIEGGPLRNVRWQFAHNPLTPKHILMELSRDNMVPTIRYLLKNPAVPDEALDWLIKSGTTLPRNQAEDGQRDLLENQGEYKMLLKFMESLREKVEQSPRTYSGKATDGLSGNVQD